MKQMISRMAQAILATPIFVIYANTTTLGEKEYVCPLNIVAEIRKSDACASEGGGFDSSRKKGTVTARHRSLDLNAQEGEEAHAIHAGKVIVADPQWEDNMGGTVIIDHGNGDYSVYGHLKDISTKPGVELKAGSKIGAVGYTGNAQCLKRNGIIAHLHLMVIRAGKSGLGTQGGPIAELKKWGTMWQKELGADLTGPINPNLIMGDLKCWKGDTNKP